MVKIVGHAWADIQRAQQGGRLHRTVDTSKPASTGPTDDDRAQLALYGSIDALKAAGLHGCVDRLERE